MTTVIYTDHAASRWSARIMPRLREAVCPYELVRTARPPTRKQAAQIAKNEDLGMGRTPYDSPRGQPVEPVVAHALAGIGDVVFITVPGDDPGTVVVLTVYPLVPTFAEAKQKG